ncbi:trans-resveratrol di-O-methyltransferase-like [Euphorbia lathyris]|uniref:trans-resveratrol di-O-methyltransferase-like n=1 Tax=Euphorbia lathyris TaxID=212925 RepID=UPI00331427F6
MVNLSDSKNKSCELLEAQAHIWNHIFNFINSMSLKCAVELGIPEIIHSHPKPITISELNAALSIHPTKAHCLPRLMRLLIHSGFFALAKTNNQNDDNEEEGYVLTNSSKLLLNDNPFSVKPFLLAMLDPVLTKPWNFGSTWFLNDDLTPFDTAHGMSLWDYAGGYPKINNFFNEAMASDSRLLSSILIGEGKEVFDGLNSVVDVGGGTGTAAKAIAKAFPQMECIVLDLPHVVDGIHDTPNLKFVAGNMFHAVPPADAIMLKWILHDWSDQECSKILEQCKKAIKERKGGKVIVIDMVRDNKKGDNEAIETQLFYDMLMMVLVTGKERNEKEWAKLFFDAGFSGYKIIPIMGLRSIIEVYP